MRKAVAGALLLLVVGCSSQALYENAQINQRHECAKQPPPTQEDCIRKTEQSYDEYERERAAVLDTMPEE